MRVVVTGAAGFIGSHLCERLLAEGHDVLGIDSFTDFYPRRVKEANLDGIGEWPGFELRELDLLAPGLEEHLAGAGAVFHLAGRPGVRDDDEAAFEAGNVGTTEAVLSAAAAARVPRVLYSSSSSIYAPGREALTEDAPCEPLSPYGRSKLRAEEVARELASGAGIELVVLRYFTVYGPRQRPDMAFARFIETAINGGSPMPLLGDGSQMRDFTYVGDAVDATVSALANGEPGIYNVAGGNPGTLRAALEQLSAQVGRAPRLLEFPRDPREHVNITANIDRARRELGYEPGTDLAAGLERQVTAALAAAAG